MTKLHDNDILALNKKKWDSWAENDTLENMKVKFLGFNFKFDFTKYQKFVVDLINFNITKTFLDIGCGNGWAVRYAYEIAGGYGDFYGADLSSNMIDKAKERNADTPKLNFVVADAAQLPFEANLFDTVISTNSFHHYPEPNRVLREVSRVLKPGGKLFILDPTANGPFAKLVNFIGKLVEKEHVNMYSSKEFRKMYEKAEISYIDSIPVEKSRYTLVHTGRK